MYAVALLCWIIELSKQPEPGGETFHDDPGETGACEKFLPGESPLEQALS